MKSNKISSALLGLAMMAVAGSADASLINFTASGSPDVSGHVQFDGSLFDGTSFQWVSNLNITDLSLTVGGFAFDLPDVVTGAGTYIDSSGVDPLIVNGGGLLADNGSQSIAFYPDGFGGTPTDGDASLQLSSALGTSYYAVQWVASTVPEPASLALVGIGLAGIGATARRRRTV